MLSHRLASKPGEIGLAGWGDEAPSTIGCPIGFEQSRKVEFFPKTSPREGEEAREAVIPLTQESLKAQEERVENGVITTRRGDLVQIGQLVVGERHAVRLQTGRLL